MFFVFVCFFNHPAFHGLAVSAPTSAPFTSSGLRGCTSVLEDQLHPMSARSNVAKYVYKSHTYDRINRTSAKLFQGIL